jgi:hypothetical protein
MLVRQQQQQTERWGVAAQRTSLAQSASSSMAHTLCTLSRLLACNRGRGEEREESDPELSHGRQADTRFGGLRAPTAALAAQRAAAAVVAAQHAAAAVQRAWLATAGVMSVQGKKVKRRASKASDSSQSQRSWPEASSMPA